MNKLPIDFYNRQNVLLIARELIGKLITTNIDDYTTIGRIVETEAYAGFVDRASHAWSGNRTARNEHMYEAPGTAYVYTCYGIHQLFNIVTNKRGIPDAVLVRAVEPVMGMETMMRRTGKPIADHTLSRGPGNVGKALGIHKIHSGMSLLGDLIYLSSDGYELEENEVGTSSRIGVAYAGSDALLPYRFFMRGNKYVSGKKIA